MRTKITNFIFIAFCCLLVALTAICTYSEASSSYVEITARVSLIAYNITAAPVTNSTENVTWITNGLANSTVDYGLDTSYGFSVSDSARIGSHTITLEGLAASQVYHYRVVSSDSGGNSYTSTDFSFTTMDTGSSTGNVVTSPELMIASGGLIPLTANNLVSQPVSIVSGDRTASLSVVASTRILNNKGQPLGRISIARIPAKDVPPVQKGSQFVFSGYAYQIEPSGATFSLPPALKISTAPAEWHQIAGKNISIQYYNPVPGHWEPLSTTTNQTAHTALASITHTSDFGLFSRQASFVFPTVTITTPTPAPRHDQVPQVSAWSIEDFQKSLEFLVNKYLISPFQQMTLK